MHSTAKSRRFVKPAVCDSNILRQPIAPCEILPAGLSGSLVINGTVYVAEILGYLPDVGEPVIDGYRLTKDHGEAHDICLVAGRLERTCGDWLWRRSSQTDRALADCKHCMACRQHFAPMVDQRAIVTPVLSTVELDDL